MRRQRCAFGEGCVSACDIVGCFVCAPRGNRARDGSAARKRRKSMRLSDAAEQQRHCVGTDKRQALCHSAARHRRMLTRSVEQVCGECPHAECDVMLLRKEQAHRPGLRRAVMPQQPSGAARGGNAHRLGAGDEGTCEHGARRAATRRCGVPAFEQCDGEGRGIPAARRAQRQQRGKEARVREELGACGRSGELLEELDVAAGE